MVVRQLYAYLGSSGGEVVACLLMATVVPGLIPGKYIDFSTLVSATTTLDVGDFILVSFNTSFSFSYSCTAD